MSAPRVQLHRWDEIALEKVTEMVARKCVTGLHATVVQVYLKRGAVIPIHAHESEQMSYVLRGALRALVGEEELTVRDGEVLHVPPAVSHQIEALDDTLVIDVFSPARTEWVG